MSAKETRTRPTKRWGLFGCMAIAPAIAFAGGAWRIGAESMLEAVEQFATELPEGVTVSYSVDRIEGFPLRLRAPLRDVQLRYPRGEGYEAERLLIETDLLRPNRLTFRTAADQRIAIGRHAFIVTMDRASLSVREDCESAPCAQATIVRVRVNSSVGASPWALSAARARIILAYGGSDGGAGAELEIVSVSAGQGDAPVFERVAGSGMIAGPTDLAPFGSLDLRSFELQAGAASISASGVIGVGASGNLDGTIALVIDRPIEIAERLRKADILVPEQIDAVSAALALAAFASGGAVQLDVEFRGGGVFIDGRRMAELGCVVCEAPHAP